MFYKLDRQMWLKFNIADGNIIVTGLSFNFYDGLEELFERIFCSMIISVVIHDWN